MRALEKCITQFKGNLTELEWQKLVCLEYVLTWNYTDNYNSDLERFKHLIEKEYGKD